jgi:hypothetical protein
MSYSTDMAPLRKLTMEQLVVLMKKIQEDPANKNPDPHSIYLYSPKAKKKLDLISRAITEKLAEKKQSEGRVHPIVKAAFAEADARDEIRQKYGYGDTLDAKPFLRTPVVPTLEYFHGQAVFIETDGDKAAAQKLGRKFQQNLKSSKGLPSSYPELRDKILYVGYNDGYVELPPLK